MIAATCFPSSTLKEGPNWPRVAVDVTVPPPVVTATFTLPVALSSGACRLICVGLTYQRYASLLLILTLVPPSVVGKSPFQVAAALARFVPKIEIHEPA